MLSQYPYIVLYEGLPFQLRTTQPRAKPPCATPSCSSGRRKKKRLAARHGVRDLKSVALASNETYYAPCSNLVFDRRCCCCSYIYFTRIIPMFLASKWPGVTVFGRFSTFKCKKRQKYPCLCSTWSINIHGTARLSISLALHCKSVVNSRIAS